MFLDMKLTILMSQFEVTVETQQLMLQIVIKITQQKIVQRATIAIKDIKDMRANRKLK